MTALRDYVAKMLERHPALGEVVAVTGLAAQSVTAASLAVGTVSNNTYLNKHLWRPYTATAADRFRICSAFTASSGALTHAGAAYSDTTATGEQVFITEHRTALLINAVQATLDTLNRLDEEVVPARKGVSRHWLHELDWIRSPGDVEKVYASDSPVLSRNRYFEKWSEYQSTGALGPDWWTLAGSGATVMRSTTQNRQGKYAAALTRSGTDCTLTQIVGLLETGVSDDSLRGEVVTAVVVAWASVADRVRVQVTDGVTTSSSSFHTGDSTWQELSVEFTPASTATTLSIAVSLEDGDTTIYADECYLVRGSLTDAVRRDEYHRRPVYDKYNQSGTMEGIFGQRSQGQYIVTAPRPFAQFVPSRVIAGTADADESDAPLDVVAVGAIARLYQDLAGRGGEDVTRYRGLAAEWAGKYRPMAERFLNADTERQNTGLDIPRRVFGPTPGRF